VTSILAAIPAKAIAVNESGVMKLVNEKSAENSTHFDNSATSSEPQDQGSSKGNCF
jgi:hypothetical protein